MRRNRTLGLIFGLVTLSLATSAFANINGFIGNWQNVDAKTRGITRLVITRQGADLSMRAWGQCHPQDCDWGSVGAYAYGPNVSANLNHTAQAVSALFTPQHAQTLVIVHKAGKNRIRAEVLTRFTDKSKRTNYRNVHTFARAHKPPVHPKEDCVGFNPNTTAVKEINKRWKIVDGSHWMFDFGNKVAEARKALAIIKHYRMNKSCFVGRPNPSFSYMLVNNGAPRGAMKGEDCVSFNPRTAQVKQIGNRWKIVDGNHMMFDFAKNANEARESLGIIKKYGFTRSCFVGRPGPSFEYLRK
jgi:hypothetical protein